MKAKQHTPINPMGTRHGGEYQQETMVVSARECKPQKGEAPKGKMVDGPFGGKKPA